MEFQIHLMLDIFAFQMKYRCNEYTLDGSRLLQARSTRICTKQISPLLFHRKTLRIPM